MSFDSKRSAQAFGRKILKILKGTGWKTRVWDNLGWHVGWELGRVSLHVENYADGNVFSCLIADDDKSIGAGACSWTTSFTSKDPNEVVEHDLKHALKIGSEMLKGLKDSQKMLKGYKKVVLGGKKKPAKRKKAR